MVIGGQDRTRNFTPVLLAPHKKTATASPAAIAQLLGLVRTDGD
jgi:hypothetical protein